VLTDGPCATRRSPAFIFCFFAYVEGAREPKIRDFEDPLVVHEEVGGLEVAVDHVGLVAVAEALQQLPRDALDLRGDCFGVENGKINRLEARTVADITM
jgi:hypothetical protein